MIPKGVYYEVGFWYRLLSASNDAKSVKKGDPVKRYMRKKSTKAASKAINKLFK